VKAASGGLVAVVVTFTVRVEAAVGTVTAARVLSSTGVAVYFVLSSPKETVEKGRAEREAALGKARR
jgi:hypothetical protein